MAKKKKKGRQDARGYGQGPPKQPTKKATPTPKVSVSNSSTTNAAFKTNVTSRTHYNLVDLLELLQQQHQDTVIEAPSAVDVTSSDRFRKKLTTIHDKLDAIGFAFEQIQKVVQALGYSITLESALDWFCWHVPTKELPPLLTEGAVRDDEQDAAVESKNASLTVLPSMKNTLSSKTSILEPNRNFLPMKLLRVSDDKSPKQPVKNDEPQESLAMQADEKARILAQYQYEDGEGEVDGEPSSQQEEVVKEDELSPDKILLLQMEEELRLAEADSKDEAANYMRSKYEVKELQKQVKQLRKQVEGLRRKVERQEAESKHAEQTVDDDDDEEEEGGMFDIFSASVAPVATTEDALTTPEPSVEPIVPEDSVPKNWTGKTPKVILEEWCRKQKVPLPKYEKLNGDGCRVSVKLKPPLVVEQEGPIAEKFADTREYMATKALYHINATLPLYRLFPPFYRDMWLSWLKEAQNEMNAGLQELQDAKDAKIDMLMQSIPSPETATAPSADAPKSTKTSETVQSAVPDDWDDSDGDDTGDVLESSIVTETATATGERLKEEFIGTQKTSGYQSMLKERSALPIYGYREETLQTIQDHPVTIVHAETGAGKTTQCPQFLLEEALLAGRGDNVNIICTQPRRVAATSVAERVSDEMCEKAVGDMVGYQIRLEAKRSFRTRLLFCTTGVVLRRLQDDPELRGVSHVVVDEVHERQYQIDVLLITLRQLVATTRRDLKVILMSATLDAQLFCSFFGGAPLVSVPGRTFPVASYYLEDLVEATGHLIEEGSHYAMRDLRGRERTASMWVTTKGGEKRKQTVSLDSELYSEEVSEQYAGYSMPTRRTMDRVNEEIINFDLLEDVLGLILVEANKNNMLLPPEGVTMVDGSVLIFLPGLGEIRAMTERLGASRTLGNRQRFEVIPMHSTLSPTEQRRAFLKPKKGCRKIILATNIAETSVTIPDVVCVIDTGRVREIRQNKRTSTSILVTDWCSRASAKQRSGRAGRVQPGLCLKLYSSETANHVMKKTSEPELQRVPLQEVCLSILAGGFANSCMEFLCQAPQPPEEKAVQSALDILQEVGAISLSGPNSSGKCSESLTPLGHHLSKLPIDVRLGKMLIFGALFHCLDPILTVAASLSCKSPFSTSVDNAQEAAAKHKAWRHPQSDFLTLCNVWEDFRKIEGSAQIRKFCSVNYLSRSALQEVRDLRRHFLELLAGIGFLEDVEHQSVAGKMGKWDSDALRASIYNSNGQKTEVVHAVICAGLYPHVAHLVGSPGGGDRALWHKTERLYFHSTSVNSKLPPSFRAKSSWVVFYEKFGTERRVSVSTTCFVHPFAILIFGGSIVVKHTERKVMVDDWIELGIAAQTGVMFRELRAQVDLLLKSMIAVPGKRRTRNDEDLSERKKTAAIMVDGIVNLLSSESLSF